MGVKKFKPRTMLYSRLLSDKADDVRRSAAKTVQDARATVHKAENLMAQSHAVVEKAEKELTELKRKKAERATKKNALKQEPG